MALVWDLRSRAHAPGRREKVRHGLNWFLAATLLQFGVGTWWLTALPRNVMLMFMGGSARATVFFLLGVAGTLLALIFGFKARVRLCAAATLVTVLCMVLMCDFLRTAMLEPYFSLSMLEVNPQYGSLWLFLVFLAIGCTAILYMLKIAFKNDPEVRS